MGYLMINRKLIELVPKTRQSVLKSVGWQELSLIANVGITIGFANLFDKMYQNKFQMSDLIFTVVSALFCMFVRSFAIKKSARENYVLAQSAKKQLRNKLYEKLISLGPSYKQNISTSEAVQICTEGVEQLEMYFGAYLPQFFYSMIAPLTLFCIILTINVKVAVVLFLGVPLIPISIALVQTIAKRLLSKYWTQYLTLGDSFLENLQGLTTLKIYQADEYKHRLMNQEAEHFRIVTMKVLKMQLNSIIIMDLVAFGGAALAMFLSFHEMHRGNITLSGAIIIVLLSADFFIPMRLLGSFFHVAMNGMAAAKKMFELFEKQEEKRGDRVLPDSPLEVQIKALEFSYGENPILKNVDMIFPSASLTAIVRESGSGKSTISALISGRLLGFHGQIKIGDSDIMSISKESLLESITTINYSGYLFGMSVRENLLMAKPDAKEEQLLAVLKSVRLYDELGKEGALDKMLENEGSNLSGGQRQRLNLARALLRDSRIYIFDEATSNVDVESENCIMEIIYNLAHEKTVILITHRLLNAKSADRIYVLKDHSVWESGTHEELIRSDGEYAKLYYTQQNIEEYIEKKKGGSGM